ncbi:MAG: PA domain-containing protein, partial [Candidatus Eisenbacteria bacterium]
LTPLAARAATIVIVNSDGAGEGFNDTTPAAPVGGNTGTTLGAQRLFVFQYAANIWGNILPSAVTIKVSSQFNPLSCDASSAALGSAGAVSLLRNFPNAEFTGTWYPAALANRLAGIDLDPAGNDINAQFNSTLDGGTCLGGQTWYYGVDGNEPANKIELLPVVLHELGHGLGFAQYGNLSTGALFNSGVDIYQRFIFDNSVGLHWNDMTNGQRATSAINTGHVGWDGSAVKVVAPTMLGQRTEVRVLSPAGIAGLKVFGVADFGPAAGASLISGSVVLADDGSAPTSDACTPLVNGGAMAGKIALIDRGGCAFVQKAAAAQAAGAIAVVIANNVAGTPPAMGGSDPSLTIPTVSISQADGNLIKGQLGTGVTMSIGPNPSFLAGADDNGRVLLYAPNPIETGSSISHWDVSAEPSLLMEPFITNGLSSSVDLTKFAFEDIGWFQPRVTSVGPGGGSGGLALRDAWPNPFTVTTSIGFTLPRAGRTDVGIFDVAGREVRHLLSMDLPAGTHAATWDGRDDAGARVAPGVFFYRVVAPGLNASKRMVRVSAGG